MDQARIGAFLDEGWCLIDQLHRWSSKSPVDAVDRPALIDVIRDLQKLWAIADDLQLNRLSRTILAIEQILERICARSLAFSGERFDDVASGIEGLQELLLGFEATREEPIFANLDTVLRLERQTQQATGNVEDKTVNLLDTNAIVNVFDSEPENSVSNSALIPVNDPIDAASLSSAAIDANQVVMLEQFTANLEDTCRRLHSRVLADEAPYVTTTSRLEHLAEETRRLTDLMAREIRLMRSTSTMPNLEDSPLVLTVKGVRPASSIEDQSAPPKILHTEPAGNAPQLQRLTSTTETSPPKLESALATAGIDALRILIVEDSLFYRHLLGIAVQSAGHVPQLAESVTQGLQMLRQASDLNAILVGSTLSPAMVSEIEQRRRAGPFKVIGMTLPGHEKVPVPNLDARISKMHPQQLIAALDRISLGAPDQIRKSA